MSHVGRIPLLVRFLATLICALVGLAVAAPAAFALRVRAAGGYPSGALTRPPAGVTHTVATSGMAGWQVAAIVVAVAGLAATFAIVVDRARAARRTGIVPAT
jgi:hypothetical protein